MAKNKSQVQSSTLRWLSMIIIIVLILIFGYKSISLVQNKSCQSELALFKIELESSLKEYSTQEGSLVRKLYNVPCNADKLFFASRVHVADYRKLENYSIINESLASGGSENIFLLKKGSLIFSSRVDELDIQRPYFICLIPVGDKFIFYIEGKSPYSNIRFVKKEDLCPDINMDDAQIEEVGEELPSEDLLFADAGNDQEVNDTDGDGKEIILLDGSGSNPSGDIVTYEWIKGGSILGNGKLFNHEFDVGVHKVKLKVYNAEGNYDESELVTIKVNQQDLIHFLQDRIVGINVTTLEQSDYVIQKEIIDDDTYKIRVEIPPGKGDIPVLLAVQILKRCKEHLEGGELSSNLTPIRIIEDPVIMWHLYSPTTPIIENEISIEDINFNSEECKELEAKIFEMNPGFGTINV